MIIVMEGIDCAGKGEISKKLAQRLNAVLYKTPPEHMRAEQDYVNATFSDQDHYRYFVKVVQTASPEIAALAKDGHVVVDRYWMTTIVYHRAMGVAACFEDFGDIVLSDLTVYLTISPEVQAKRMKERGASPGDRRMVGREDLIRQGYERVLGEDPKAVTIDTSRIPPEQVVDLILARCPWLT